MKKPAFVNKDAQMILSQNTDIFLLENSYTRAAALRNVFRKNNSRLMVIESVSYLVT